MTDVAHVGAPFLHDLFLSYSHGDNGSGRGYLQPWSEAFAKALEDELRLEPRFRRTLRIFIDQDHRQGHGIDPMAPLTEQLREQIQASALLVVLMSPDYLASSWCADERDWWFAHQRELGLPTQDRVAVVKIWPTEDGWPSALVDSRGHPLPGFAFFGDDDGAVRPLGWTEAPAFGTRFRKALVGIAGALGPKLDAMKVRVDALAQARADAATLAKPGGQTIYLHGRHDEHRTWERAALELTTHNFIVVPGEPDEVDRDARGQQKRRDQRVQTMEACDALLLVATSDTRALDADLVVVGKHDRHSARARSNRLLPCGVLNTVGTQLQTPVRQATARIVQADWIDGTQPPWTPEIQQWLGRQSQLEVVP
jgi:hypothetical protein